MDKLIVVLNIVGAALFGLFVYKLFNPILGAYQ